MWKKLNAKLIEADRAMRKFFKNLWKKIQQLPDRLRDIGAVIAYLAKHPKEIKRLLPPKKKVKKWLKKAGNALLALVLVMVITVSFYFQ